MESRTPHRLLEETLSNAQEGLTRKSPKYLGTRPITRWLSPALKLLCKWFVEKGSSLELDARSKESRETHRDYFGEQGVATLEEGLKKLQRIKNPYRLTLEGPADTPNSRMTIDVLRIANRMYEVHLRKVERLEGARWSPLPLDPERTQRPSPLQRYALHDLWLDRRSCVTHIRCRVAANVPLEWTSHPLCWAPIPPTIAGLERTQLRVHEKPSGVELVLRLRSNDLHRSYATVCFTPTLAPGQVVEYTIVVPRRTAHLLTTEDVDVRDGQSPNTDLRGLAATVSFSTSTPIGVLELVSILPRGYEIADPSLSIKDAHRLSPLTDEVGRIYGAGGFAVRRRGGRQVLLLRVEQPVVGAFYSLCYRPPREASLPAPLRAPAAVAPPPATPPRKRGARASQKRRRR